MKDVFVEDFESEPFTAAFRAYFGEIGTSARNWKMLFRQMNAERDTTRAIMRLDGNTVIGFVMFCRMELSCAFFSETFGYIRELWVDVPYRRAGHGRHLLAVAEEYLAEQGIPQIALCSTPGSETFYQKQGYTVSDVLCSEGKYVFTKKIARLE